MNGKIKPTHLKALAGTLEPGREAKNGGIDIDPIDNVPAPLDWLSNGHAVKEWERLAPILVANKLLNDSNLCVFGMLCSVHGKLVQLMNAGECPNGAMLSQYCRLVAEFGLTPASQSKIRIGKSEEKSNKFATNGKRTA
jgi:phage terminase small subunit